MKTLTNFLIDENTRRDFHLWCIQNGTTISDNLRTHIDDVLEGVTRTTMPESIVRKNAGSNWIAETTEKEADWESSY
ncbi:hypothetical protein N9V47_04065 [Luminiphilus sp.]|nr:hypothetical protein [Luminiphilus sp.]